MDGVVIWSKALDLFSFVLNKDGQLSEKIDFRTSKGWLKNFKHCFNLHNVKLQGEAGSSDKEAAEKFKPQFLKFIEERGYIPQQVFNADELGLFYKWMGQRIYITKTQKDVPVFKAFKDRLTLLSCGNHQVTSSAILCSFINLKHLLHCREKILSNCPLCGSGSPL